MAVGDLRVFVVMLMLNYSILEDDLQIELEIAIV
jgi:hypothetical protein